MSTHSLLFFIMRIRVQEWPSGSPVLNSVPPHKCDSHPPPPPPGVMECHRPSLSASQPDSWIHNILDVNGLQRCGKWEMNLVAPPYPTPKNPKEKLSPGKGGGEARETK